MIASLSAARGERGNKMFSDTRLNAMTTDNLVECFRDLDRAGMVSLVAGPDVMSHQARAHFEQEQRDAEEKHKGILDKRRKAMKILAAKEKQRKEEAEAKQRREARNTRSIIW